MGLEIFVADVASAGNAELVVGDEQFVVHAPVEAITINEKLREPDQRVVPAMAESVEHADFHVGLRVQRQDVRFVFEDIDVVQQHPDPHAAFGGLQQGIGNDRASLVAMENVVLDVECLFRLGGQPQAAGQCVHAGVEQQEPRSIRHVFRRSVGQLLQAGGCVPRKRIGSRAQIDVFVLERGTAAQKPT